MSEQLAAGVHPFWREAALDPEAARAAAERLTALDADRFIPHSRVPVLHQFGTRDVLVSREEAETLARLTPAPKQVRFYDADHGVAHPDARRDRWDFLTEVLGLTAPAAHP